MAGAYLRLAEEQRRIVPAAIERIGDLRRDAGHLGLVLAEPVDDVGQVLQYLRPLELVVVERQRDVRAVVGDDVEQPVRHLDISVAGLLGVAKRAHERVIAEAVQFSGDGFETDVSHGLPS